MSMYGSPGGSELSNVPRAHQACMSCRKQKRKCNKALPACSLCERMNRPCDYSEVTPPPTHEDFNALRMKLLDLESRLTGANGGGAALNPPIAYPATPGSVGIPTDTLGPPVGFSALQESPWQGIQNTFPVIAFLDGETFRYGRIAVPIPNIDIPVDVLELLGDGASIQGALTDYFATIHRWIPIVSQKRMTRNMVNPLWEAGPDLALLFLCMKLITSRPQDGIGCAQNPIYLSAKRFITLMETSGMVSLIVLQANLMVTLYEYGQAIYPAAWMSSGWNIRYGNMLGINTFEFTSQLLGRSATWTEQEERKRTWWGVLLVDRMLSLGGQSHIITNQEPKDTDLLPVDDAAWDEGNMTQGIAKTGETPYSEQVAPFPRLCQVSHLLGKIFVHHDATFPSDKDRFDDASRLFEKATSLSRILQEEATDNDYVSLSAAIALSFSAICAVCDPYSCPKTVTGHTDVSTETAEAQLQAIDGLKRASQNIVEFAERLNTVMPLPQDVDRISPFIMDAMYCAAANHAWWVRESGDANSQLALDNLRNCLRRLGTRWRNAAEYLRILEAQEFTYAIGGAGP
ncbi:hypothetical protein B7463_g9567, partial [Scytalidium lignicola]